MANESFVSGKQMIKNLEILRRKKNTGKSINFLLLSFLNYMIAEAKIKTMSDIVHNAC